MARFLASVSFESGAHPDYSSLPSLFAEGARLVRTASGQPESIGIDEFVRDRTEQVRSGQLNAFAERETAQVTERFGNVAHRFSTYSKRSEHAGAVAESDGTSLRSSSRPPPAGASRRWPGTTNVPD